MVIFRLPLLDSSLKNKYVTPKYLVPKYPSNVDTSVARPFYIYDDISKEQIGLI